MEADTVHEYQVALERLVMVRLVMVRLSSVTEGVFISETQVTVYSVMTPLRRSSGGGLHWNITLATPSITVWVKSVGGAAGAVASIQSMITTHTHTHTHTLTGLKCVDSTLSSRSRPLGSAGMYGTSVHGIRSESIGSVG